MLILGVWWVWWLVGIVIVLNCIGFVMETLEKYEANRVEEPASEEAPAAPVAVEADPLSELQEICKSLREQVEANKADHAKVMEEFNQSKAEIRQAIINDGDEDPWPTMDDDDDAKIVRESVNNMLAALARIEDKDGDDARSSGLLEWADTTIDSWCDKEAPDLGDNVVKFPVRKRN